MAPRAWIPNEVDGASIWKDVRALNAPSLFAGRLLVPRPAKKGPARMRWDVAGLLPLAEALDKHPTEVAAALVDLRARVAKVRAELDDPASSVHRLAAAFCLPRLDDPREARSYFFEPKTRELRIANWGARRPPAGFANEREDEEGPPSALGATLDLGPLEATQEYRGAVPTAPPISAEQEAELEAVAARIDGDLAETREALDLLDLLLTQGEVVAPE